MNNNNEFSNKLFSNLQVQLELKVGEITTSVNSVLEIKPGDVLDTEMKISDSVSLLYEGNEIASGILIERDGYFGIQIKRVTN